VGLITNQTSLSSNGTKTRLLLAKGTNLVALYTPEHGLDGTEKAGVEIRSRKDPLTGLTAYSLYGDTRKPTPEMLAGIDVLVFDLQDIGCRSYTYISTMARCLEACAEQGKQFVVLDRPNPLGGNRVEGMPIEPAWISFVGQLPVPYVHGMTAGELALMANAKGWVKGKADLKVVKMRGWHRDMAWTDTGLRWIPTSPNIPNAMSPFYYVITGLVGSLAGGLDIGIGTPRAFQYLTAPWLNQPKMLKFLNSAKQPDIRIEPYQSGIIFIADPHAAGDLCETALALLWESNRQSGGAIFKRASKDQLNIFFKVYGSEAIRAKLGTQTASQIIAGWRPSLENFRHERQPYLLY